MPFLTPNWQCQSTVETHCTFQTVPTDDYNRDANGSVQNKQQSVEETISATQIHVDTIMPFQHFIALLALHKVAQKIFLNVIHPKLYIIDDKNMFYVFYKKNMFFMFFIF